MTDVADELVDALAHVSHVREAATRLGVTPEVVADRIKDELAAFGQTKLSETQEERGYQMIVKVRELARALKDLGEAK